MLIRLSDEAVDEFERLERDEPNRFELLVDDLTMLERADLAEVARLAEIGGLAYLQGPTGRVRYWVGIDDDVVVVEYFDLD